MFLIVTIDTEEDNWGEYNLSEYSLSNIERIPYLQELFDEFDVKPTYLITYPVANDERCVSILKKIMDEGKCEIGAHCHPWNTPPIEEERNEKNSMLCNLPQSLQYRKIKTLRDKIKENFGINPISFRAGRWGFNDSVSKNLIKLNFKIDTSVTPFINWEIYFGPNFSEASPFPFKLKFNNSFHTDLNEEIIEIPVTIGFLRKNFSLSNRVLNGIKKSYLRHFSIIGLLSTMKLINLVWLSPELNNGKDMIKLSRVMMQKHYKIINMTFHSSSLKEGLNQFVKKKG